ncbi:hypothetical protein [Streptomyces sp. NPDC014734]|uniref:hypothetical protein n=1 Tax=Streptomyces sp. NPDC014734 TaxID=3364886 RepID=UPI0036FC6A7B
MRSARSLEQAHHEVERTAHAAERAESDRGQAARLHDKGLQRLGAAENRLRAADRHAQNIYRQAAKAAATARVVFPANDLPDDGRAPSELRGAVEESVERGHRSAHLGGTAHARRPAGRSRRGPVRGR